MCLFGAVLSSLYLLISLVYACWVYRMAAPNSLLLHLIAQCPCTVEMTSVLVLFVHSIF